jgi:GNAT superfamily N-acetyltransferase
MTEPGPGVAVRGATDDAVTGAVSVLEAAMLEVDAGRVRRLSGDDADGAVLVAVPDGASDAPSSGVVLGALVLDGREIDALAVRPRRRGGGIGSALVRAAADRIDGPLLAAFDADLRAFYERLGFAIERSADGRYRGRRDPNRED